MTLNHTLRLALAATSLGFGLTFAAYLPTQCDGVVTAQGGANITWLYPHSDLIGCMFAARVRAQIMDIPRLLRPVRAQKA